VWRWRSQAIDAGLAGAAAALAAATDYVFGFASSLGDASFRVAATFVLTASVLTAARFLGLENWPAGAPNRSDDNPPPLHSNNCGLPERAYCGNATLTLMRLGEVAAACNPIVYILCEHLQDSITHTEEQAETTIVRVRDVDNAVTKLISTIHNISHTKLLSAIEHTETCLSLNRSSLQGFAARSEEAAKESNTQLLSVAAQAGKLETTLQAIRKLSKRTSMLALNAAIEATKAGTHGRGFAVVAAEVKALALQTEQAAINISDGIRALRASIEQSMESLVVQRGVEQRSEIACMTHGMNELGHNSDDVFSTQRTMLDKIREESQKTSNLVLEMLASIQGQDIDRQRLLAITAVLHQIIAHAASLGQAMESGNLEKDYIDNTVAALETLRQRASQDSRITQVQSSAAPAIELF
jgi:methyl-accepting chemotaxis protein